MKEEEGEDVTKIVDYHSSIDCRPKTSVDLVLPEQGEMAYDGRIVCPHCRKNITNAHRCGELRRIFKRNEERQARADAHNLKYIEMAKWDDDTLRNLYAMKRFDNKSV